VIGFLSLIIPLIVMGGFWYLVVKAGRKAKDRPRSDRPSTPPPPQPSSPARPAAEKSFGRRAHAEAAQTPEVRQFVPLEHHFPLSSYGMKQLRAPHGFDIAFPESRTIPDRFQGDWLWEEAKEDPSHRRISLGADSLIYFIEIGAEPVVGAYTLNPDSPDEIAIVTQQMEDGQWLFATYLFKLLDGGTKITNLESMDMKWVRA
jgi:hypothetical protein